MESGGCATFRHGGRTLHSGAELDRRGKPAAGLRGRMALTGLDATKLDDDLVPAGNRIAGMLKKLADPRAAPGRP